MRLTQYPGKPMDEVIQGEEIRIQQIKATLRLDVGHFERYFIPVLEAYASFVHLLPASEHHHHAWPGGLFTHGIEVALIAARASSKFLYGHRDLPRLQDTMEERWRLGIALAGLLHDVGKPFVGLKVVGSNHAVWNPYFCSLTQWLSQARVDQYHIEWEKGRHAVHEQLGASMLHILIPKTVMEHLTEHGGHIWESMLTAIAASNDDRKFGALVKTADHLSVAADLGNQANEASPIPRVRTEEIVLRTMRKLVDEKVWTWNTSKSRLWDLEGQTHVVWKAAVHDLFKIFEEEHSHGIPRDPDVLADLLIERGIAVPCQRTDGTLNRYWIHKLPDIDKSPYLLQLTPNLISRPNVAEQKKGTNPIKGSFEREKSTPNMRASSFVKNDLPVDDPPASTHSLDPLLHDYFARLMPKGFGESIVTKGDCLFLHHMACAKQLGIPAADLIKAIVGQKLHQPDPVIVQRDIQEHEGKLGLLLKKDISTWILNEFQSRGEKSAKSPKSTKPESVLSNLLNKENLPTANGPRIPSKVRPWRHSHAE